MAVYASPLQPGQIFSSIALMVLRGLLHQDSFWAEPAQWPVPRHTRGHRTFAAFASGEGEVMVKEAERDVEELEEFLGMKAPKKTIPKPVRQIAAVNKTADTGLEIIQNFKSAIPEQRKALDAAMAARMAELKPLCNKYMFRRAELLGLFAAQCTAAQGRLNAEELTDEGGPPGCVNRREIQDKGAWTLPEKRCTWGFGSHELKCSTRLDYLEDGEAAPNSDPKGESHSMDEWVRRWCHPRFSLPGRPLNADLAAGEHVGNEEAELAAEAGKPNHAEVPKEA